MTFHNNFLIQELHNKMLFLKEKTKLLSKLEIQRSLILNYLYVRIASYIQNKTLINKNLIKNPYNFMPIKNPSINNFHAFGRKFFVFKDNSK